MTAPKLFYGYVVVGATFLTLLVVWAGYYTFGIFFRPVLDEFGWTRAMTSGAFSMSTIVTGVLAVLMGSLTDRFGPRLVMTFCGLMLSVGYFLMSRIGAVWQLYIFYGLILGVGMSGGYIPLMTTVARWFVRRRGLMMGVVVSGVGVGGLIGPPLANRIITAYGWRTSYLILGGVVTGIVLLSAQFLKRDPAQLGIVALGEDDLDIQASNSGIKSLSVREAIRTSQFWMVCGINCCFGIGLFSILVHVSPHVIDLGISPAIAAGVLATIGGSSFVGKLLSGRAADSIGSRMTLGIGLALMAAAYLLLASAITVWVLYVFAIIFGLAYGACVPSIPHLVAGLFGLSSNGAIFGTANVFFNIGGALGPFFTGLVFDLTGRYRIAFLSWAGVCLTGLILAAILKPRQL